jgi:hypothetical protein
MACLGLHHLRPEPPNLSFSLPLLAFDLPSLGCSSELTCVPAFPALTPPPLVPCTFWSPLERQEGALGTMPWMKAGLRD